MQRREVTGPARKAPTPQQSKPARKRCGTLRPQEQSSPNARRLGQWIDLQGTPEAGNLRKH